VAQQPYGHGTSSALSASQLSERLAPCTPTLGRRAQWRV